MPSPDDDPTTDPGDRPTRRLDGLPEEPAHLTSADDDRDGRWQFGGRDMRSAIISGVALVIALIFTVLWHPAAFTVLVLAIVLVGVVETSGVISREGHPVAMPVLVVAAVVILVGAYRAGPAGQAVGVSILFVGSVIWELADSRRGQAFREVANTCMIGLWVVFLASYAVLLVNRPVDGWVAILATAGVAIVSDIAAFAVGTKFGRRKLAPSISPGKSWEGVLGGLGVSVVLAALILPVLGTGEMFTPASAMVFALFVGVAGVLGDLAESMVKRDIGVKDLGGLIPGHGGMLDRADSLLFALPTGYYVLAIVGN